jgi:dienelactone hydrolase
MTGTAPGVLIWPDIFGLRPAFRQLVKRLAESGYAVLVVNPFYRTKNAPTAGKGAAMPLDQVIPLAQSLSETTDKNGCESVRDMAVSSGRLGSYSQYTDSILQH